jgi:outer membrane protein W
MKKLSLFAFISLFSLNSFAELKPYFGLNVDITNSVFSEVRENTSKIDSYTRLKKSIDSATGVDFGVIYSKHEKINFSYFSTTIVFDKTILQPTVISASYDYNFFSENNRGFSLGAGLSYIDTLITRNEKELTSTTGIGPVLRIGYEYIFNNNIYLNSYYNIHYYDQKNTKEHSGGKTYFKTNITVLGILFGYAF